MRILDKKDLKYLENLINDITKEHLLEKKAMEDDEDMHFKVAGSVEMIDRHNEIVLIDGIDYKDYLNNPVVLQDHIYSVDYLIGKTIKIFKEGTKLIFEGYFNDTEKGLIAQKLYKGGFLNAVSIGFIVKERDSNNKSVINKSELLEISFVVVQSNRMALSEKGFTDKEIDIVFSDFAIEKKSEKEVDKDNQLDLSEKINTILVEINDIKSLLKGQVEENKEIDNFDKKEFLSDLKGILNSGYSK